MNRNLDDIYFRIERNGKYENVCFSDMTESEQREVLKDKPIRFVTEVALEMAKRLHEIGEELDLKYRDDWFNKGGRKMTTNLSKVNSLILNSYINTINNFVGEKIINEVDEENASGLDKDTFKFFEKLAHRILNIKSCSRNCFLREVDEKWNCGCRYN